MPLDTISVAAYIPILSFVPHPKPNQQRKKMPLEM